MSLCILKHILHVFKFHEGDYDFLHVSYFLDHRQQSQVCSIEFDSYPEGCIHHSIEDLKARWNRYCYETLITVHKMVLKTDENGDEYFNYYDISEVQDDTLKFLSDFVDNFLHTIVLQCLIIGLVFFIFLVLLWIFSHDVCIPCVACFNSKGAWLYNIILCLTCGLLRKPAFRIVERYCKRDGIFLQYNDYKEKIRQFDEMAKLVDEGDKGLIDKGN
uniref:Uncharacterized protein n=1 Tax=Tetranychus urticae TaxID=32264 RepID=T1KIN0_TETUR